MTDPREKAREALADAVIDDLTDRRGIRRAFDQIDEETTEEIRQSIGKLGAQAYEAALSQPIEAAPKAPREKAIEAASKAYREENIFGNEMASAIDAYEAALWQPMETAPKDAVIWATDGESQYECWFETGIEFSSPFNNWTTGPETVAGYDAGFRMVCPTYWRPLPAMPSKEDAG